MNKKDLEQFKQLLEQKRDENLDSAKDSALKYTITNDGVAQRKALVDHAASETYSAVLNYIVEKGQE